MPSLRELRRKIKSVKSTQQITKAMKMVAAARLNHAQERILAARPFANKLEELLAELASLSRTPENPSRTGHPFFESREGARLDVVLVTADRGLCGGFNANLIRHTLHYLRGHPGKEVRLWIVGKKGRDYFKRYKMRVEKEYVGIFRSLGYHQAEILGQDVIDTFLRTDTSRLVFVYNEFKSRMQQRLVVKDLLPLQPIEGVHPRQDFIYEPSQKAIFESLLPRYVKGQIFRILLESQAAELAARMAAMDSATKNAKDMIYSLTLNMNKIRQATITKEISEIVGGAEALQR